MSKLVIHIFLVFYSFFSIKTWKMSGANDGISVDVVVMVTVLSLSYV